jgi:nitrite reductase/ring-hydroxylating ferredoxin subunit
MSANNDRLHFVIKDGVLDEDERVICDIAGREIAVFNVYGEYHAVGNYCPHMGGPCAEGKHAGFFEADEDGSLTCSRESGVIACPWHGWEFDIKTGEQLSGSKKRLLTYDVIVRDDTVYVEL